MTTTVNKTPVVKKTAKVPQEEPTTELKRVPYRITDNQEGDMFEDFSCSSEFEKIGQIDSSNVGQGLIRGGPTSKDQMSFNLNITNVNKQSK